MKHRYVDTIQLTCTLGVIANAKWYTNGMYDPNVAVGGHQPYGFDQMLNYYKYATVLGSKITAEFMPAAATTTVPTVCGIQSYASEGSASPFTLWNTMKEMGMPMRLIAATPTHPVKCHSGWSFKKNFKQNSAIGEQASTAGANPGRMWTYEVWIQSQDAVSTTAVYNVTIIIDYAVRWTDRQTMAASSIANEPVMVYPTVDPPRGGLYNRVLPPNGEERRVGAPALPKVTGAR